MVIEEIGNGKRIKFLSLMATEKRGTDIELHRIKNYGFFGTGNSVGTYPYEQW